MSTTTDLPGVIAMVPRLRDAQAGRSREPLHGLLTALGRAMARSAADRDLAGVFEQALRDQLAMRAVRLREIPARYHARLVTPTRTVDSVVLGVPSANPHVQTVLEASCGPNRLLEEGDVEVLAAAAQLGGLVLEATRGRAPMLAPQTDRAVPMIGSTQVMQALRERIDRVGLTDFTVLVEGESGTGKELVARQLHDVSRRRSGPFVAVNCAAVVETLLEAELFGIEERTATGVRGRRGKFEHAEGGTLFLDEVSDLSLAAQAKLLRAIQELAVERVGGQGARRVNTRIIAATNRPLADLVACRQFRADLYYRLGGVEIQVPPLRGRKDDILELAQYFLDRHGCAREMRIAPAAQEALRAYDWPGNVRELERMMERAVTLAEGDRIELEHLPPQVREDVVEVLGPALRARDSMRAWGSRYARLVFERCGRNKRLACRALGISYHTLQAYLRYGEASATRDMKELTAWVRSDSDPAGNPRG
jgi:transcriptional regulator with PAS, ATPase and Fis domain